MVKRKICVVLANRANYSSIKGVMRAVQQHPDLELQVVAGSSILLERYGLAVSLVEQDGFNINGTFHMIVEGENPTTMAKSTGLGIIELATLFNGLQPDFVIAVGDRFEIMSTAITAAFMNIPLVHTMGGEVSGTIDESIRHAITKLAHVHFPANQESADRIIKMGESPEHVHVVGCPRMDLIKDIIENNHKHYDDIFNKYKGVGGVFDLNEPFLLVSQHPVTTEFGTGREHISATLHALEELKMPTIMLWPNVDAGSEEIVKEIRTFREKKNPQYLHLFKNLPIDVYVMLMTKCKCLIGNSSSAIREGAFIGTPAVNIGTRQKGRQRGRNVIDVGYDSNAIVSAIKKQLENGRYSPEYLYGDGNASKRVADILATTQVDIQKIINY